MLLGSLFLEIVTRGILRGFRKTSDLAAWGLGDEFEDNIGDSPLIGDDTGDSSLIGDNTGDSSLIGDNIGDSPSSALAGGGAGSGFRILGFARGK